MPLYDYKCPRCGCTWEERAPVGTNHKQCACGAEADRQFTVCQMIQTPAHFQFQRGWHLPQTAAEHAHAEKMQEEMHQLKNQKAKPYRQFVEEKLAADRRITIRG